MMKILKKVFLVFIALIVCYGYLGELGAAVSATPPYGTLEIKMLDVGHGDAILLRTADVTLLVDTGKYKNSDKLAGKLKALGVKDINGLILTHHHVDHIGGVFKVLNSFSVRQIYDNGIENPKSSISQNLGRELRSGRFPHCIVSSGQKLSFKNGLQLEFLAPPSRKIFPVSDINNNSIVFKLYYGDFSMLFAADIEAKAEHDLVKRYGKMLESDVLKVAHHGSGTSSTYNFLKHVNPQLALISCGDIEEYNHPNKKVLGTMSYLKIPYKVTSWQGDITLTTSGKGFVLQSSK